MRTRRALILFVIFLSSWCLAGIEANTQSQNIVRVAIVQDAEALNVRIIGGYEIIDPLSQKVLAVGRDLNTTVTISKDEILLGKGAFSRDRLLIKASDSGLILIGDRKFRGTIQLIRKENLRLLLINHVALEDYVKGILYHEVSHYWPMEVLKAQAIVCRSYAVYQMQESRAKDYDVTSDVFSQVYGGKTSERYRTSEAVDKTRLQVIMYNEKVLPAYFHSTCGGHTEDAVLLWNINLPPLKGVTCRFCQGSPHLQWHAVLPLEEIEEELSSTGYAGCKNIKTIKVSGKDASGRLTNLGIITDKKEIIISAKDFRNTVGPNIIKSTNFSLSLVSRDAVFEGIGWGHGVGMCQWGAYFMAKQGFNYKQILSLYYPHTDVKTL